MKDLFLIPVMLAIFVSGYYAVKRAAGFLEENERLIAAENRQNRYQLRIAAESPMLLDSLLGALTTCCGVEPRTELFLSSGKAKRLLQKLRGGMIDIVLLSEINGEDLGRECQTVRIPYQTARIVTAAIGLPVENLDETEWVYVVWSGEIPSERRDKVIAALKRNVRETGEKTPLCQERMI